MNQETKQFNIFKSNMERRSIYSSADIFLYSMQSAQPREHRTRKAHDHGPYTRCRKPFLHRYACTKMDIGQPQVNLTQSLYKGVYCFVKIFGIV